MKDMTTSEFAALVDELRKYARAYPINIVERVKAGLGPPLDHRRDFSYRGCWVRVLLTEDRLPFPSGMMCGEHLSVMGLDEPLPAEVTKGILEAFFPGHEESGPGNLLTMPSSLPGCTQYILLTPEETRQ